MDSYKKGSLDRHRQALTHLYKAVQCLEGDRSALAGKIRLLYHQAMQGTKLAITQLESDLTLPPAVGRSSLPRKVVSAPHPTTDTVSDDA